MAHFIYRKWVILLNGPTIHYPKDNVCNMPSTGLAGALLSLAPFHEIPETDLTQKIVYLP